MLNAKLINNPYNYFLFFSHFRNNNITFYTICDYYGPLRHIAPPLLAQTTKKLPKSIVCIKYSKMCAHTVNFAKNYSQNVC